MKSNALKTFILLTLMTGLFLLIGGLIGGKTGILIAFAFALLMNFFSYWFSSSIVLKTNGAIEVTEADSPQLINMVHNLATKAGIPMPKVYIIPEGPPNAFATGRNPQHGVVALTASIVKTLESNELEGVIAHELSHIANRDILISTIAATIAGAIMFLASMARYATFFGGSDSNENRSNPLGIIALILASILAPIAAAIVQMAVSRAREYDADAKAANLTRQPLSLASALQKISYGVAMSPNDANPNTAHMFIMNPLSPKKSMNLFSTHPAVEDRISKLEEIEKQINGTNSAALNPKTPNPMFR